MRIQHRVSICIGVLLLVTTNFSAAKNDDGNFYVKSLLPYPNASHSLGTTLNCLLGKEYPRDIELCGVNKFGSDTQVQEVIACLEANGPVKNVRAIGRKSRGNRRVVFILDCRENRLSILFRENRRLFAVYDIGPLLN